MALKGCRMCVYKLRFKPESMVLEHFTVLSIVLIIYVPMKLQNGTVLKTDQRRKQC